MRNAIALAVLAAGLLSAADPTFSRDVSRIMQAKCQQCHRPNDIAPFSLMSFSDASTYAEDIQRVVSQKIMPPWKPVAGHGEFKNNYGLTSEERQTILDWVAAGAPEGDAGDMPDPLPLTGEWQLGDPDLVLQMPEVYDVPRQRDIYRCFVIPTGLDADKFVTAVQVLPGNKQIVHHVLLFLDSTGQSEKLDAAEDGPGYTCYGGPGIDGSQGGAASILDLVSGLGGWVPGTRIQPLPEGIGIGLPKNAKIVMQVHYFPNGRPGPDQTKIGLYFSKTAVKQRLRYIPVVNTTFKIQPGESAKEVKQTFRIPFLFDAKAYQIAPHMHLLGRKIQVELENRGDRRI
jgi:Predicted membrane protein